MNIHPKSIIRVYPATMCFIFALLLHVSASADMNHLPEHDFPFGDIASSGSGITDTLQTLESLEKDGDLYTLSYQGGYKKILERVNKRLLREGAKFQYACTMFTALGDDDRPIMGRNFDSPANGVLLGHYYPPDGYPSVAFSCLDAMHFAKDLDMTKLPMHKRTKLLEAPFFPVDGMNAKGVAVAMAQVRSQQITIDSTKKTIFITYLIRKILDQARSVDEATDILHQFNVYDRTPTTISSHLLIADRHGNSVIVEYADSKWQVIPNEQPWQVISNIPSSTISKNEPTVKCWRYKTAQVQLEKYDGKLQLNQAMDMLMSISMRSTQWSCIYDLKNQIIFVSMYTKPEIKTFSVQ